jgi:hypothetical protein
MTDRELMQMALDALDSDNPHIQVGAAISLRYRLAQPEPEAVAWMWKDGTLTSDPDYADGTWTPLFTAQPKREWVGLKSEDAVEDLKKARFYIEREIKRLGGEK